MKLRPFGVQDQRGDPITDTARLRDTSEASLWLFSIETVDANPHASLVLEAPFIRKELD
jgi:hypothetical protein